jgi:hypothetical protein
MEDTSQKHIVVLKPLMNREEDGDDPSQLKRKQISYDVNYNPTSKQQVEREFAQQSPLYARGDKKTIEADYIYNIDDATMAVCIEPGNFERYVTGFRANQLKKLRQQPELYDIKFLHAPNKFRKDRGVYQVTKKFKKIMTINMANIESIDGKPIIALHDIEKGMKHIGDFDDEKHIGDFDDEETVKEASINQPKKYRIVMRRGTVIDADHMALLNTNSDIYMVGIGHGNGPTAQRHMHHPWPSLCFDEFWMPITHTSYGQSCKGMSDQSHSDYLVTPKFQKVISMHAKNIDTINGKPVLWMNISTAAMGTSQLGQFDEWNIGNIADLLGE